MNKRQVLLLWIIALALGASVAAVKLSQKQSTGAATKRSAGQTLFDRFPAESITSIDIKGAAHHTTLAKKGNTWVVAQRDDYPANTRNVLELLRSLAELKVAQGIEAGPSFAPRFGMDESSTKAADHGLVTTFLDASGNEVAKLTIGKSIESSAASSFPFGGAAGRFVRNHADDSGFYAVNETFATLSDEPKRWLEEGFIQIEKIQSIAATTPGKPEPDWTLTRENETAEFVLEGAPEQALDSSATGPLKNLFSYARFEDVVPADQVAARTLTEELKHGAIVETFEGFTYRLTFWPAKPAEPTAAADEENAIPPATDNYLLTAEVSANLAAERTKTEDETEEDAKSQDEAFAERRKVLEERLAKEQAFAGRTFEVSKFTVDALLKNRDSLLQKADAAAPNGQPPGSLIPSGGRAISPPIRAVTPPVSVPPAEEE